MRYRISCPYCHRTIESGKGTPFKHIGDPLRRCPAPMCRKYYVDSNVYEWGALHPVYKFWFYFGANNRGIILMLFLIFACACYVGERYTAMIILTVCSVLWPPLCYAYVRIAHKYDIEESIARCRHEEHIQKLQDINYDKLYVTDNTVTPHLTVESTTAKKISFICKNCGQKLTALNTKCTSCGSSNIHQFVSVEETFPAISAKFGSEVTETIFPVKEQ